MNPQITNKGALVPDKECIMHRHWLCIYVLLTFCSSLCLVYGPAYPVLNLHPPTYHTHLLLPCIYHVQLDCAVIHIIPQTSNDSARRRLPGPVPGVFRHQGSAYVRVSIQVRTRASQKRPSNRGIRHCEASGQSGKWPNAITTSLPRGFRRSQPHGGQHAGAEMDPGGGL